MKRGRTVKRLQNKDSFGGTPRAPGVFVDNWWVDSISAGVVINHRIVRLGTSPAGPVRVATIARS